jgi:hypothetical protein
MSSLLKLLVYFFIIVGVLKYYETKLNDDKQIVMVVLLILFLIMISDYMFFKNTEGFAKKKKKTTKQKLKDRKKKIKKLKNDCPNPIGNTFSEQTKYPDVQPAVFNQCTPNPLWNNRTGMTDLMKGTGCPNTQDGCVTYRVADPIDNTKFFETAACVPIQTVSPESKIINSCANPTQYSSVSPYYIPPAECTVCETDAVCGLGAECKTTTVMDPYGPRDINGPIWGRERRSCIAKTADTSY